MGMRDWRGGLLAAIAGYVLAGCLPTETHRAGQIAAEGPPVGTPAIPVPAEPTPAPTDPATPPAEPTPLPTVPPALPAEPSLPPPIDPAPPPADPLPPPPSAPLPPPVVGNATLTWIAPAEYIDGSLLPLSELGGYRIYHGTNANTLDPIAEVDIGTTAFTVLDLGAGTHYFAVTAVSIIGVESSFSEVGSKTIL